ncbi:MAG: MerR family transcriptional regulator, partial [Gammaproteobacteria bacterium]|nr:MerR family transcriptional regulator [Gammaproteobacteria bacterium]
MNTLIPHRPAAPTSGAVRMRSGTAARLAGLPVTTLRVWERRYGVVAAPKQGNGQRLYSEADVQRLRWLRVLTQHGHAIGTIAQLDLEALRGLGTLPEAEVSQSLAASPVKALVVGRGLARRLQAAAGCEVVGVHDDLSAARDDAAVAPVDLLVVQLGSLQPDACQHVLALGARVHARQTAVLYAFGAAAAADELRAAGVQVLR